MGNSNKLGIKNYNLKIHFTAMVQQVIEKKASHSQKDNEYVALVFNFQHVWANFSYLAIIKRSFHFEWKWNTCVPILNLTQTSVFVWEERSTGFKVIR